MFGDQLSVIAENHLLDSHLKANDELPGKRVQVVPPFYHSVQYLLVVRVSLAN